MYIFIGKMTDRPKRQNIHKPRRYQTTSSEEREIERSSGRKTPMEQQQSSQLDDDVAELRGVLENDSPNRVMHVHPDQPLTYTQSSINNYKEHISNTPHVDDTTHSFCTQLFTQTTQTFSPSVTSHAPITYTQLLNVNHTTQTHSNNSLQQLNYAPQNYNTAQTFTHDRHTSTHTQHIRSGLNTLYDPKFQPFNIWPNDSHRLSSVPPSSQTSGDFYNVKSEIEYDNRIKQKNFYKYLNIHTLY